MSVQINFYFSPTVLRVTSLLALKIVFSFWRISSQKPMSHPSDILSSFQLGVGGSIYLKSSLKAGVPFLLLNEVESGYFCSLVSSCLFLWCCSLCWQRFEEILWGGVDFASTLLL